MYRPHSSKREPMSITHTHQESAAGEAMRRNGSRRRRWIITLSCVALAIGVAVPTVLFLRPASAPPQRPVRYVGLYTRTSPLSYTGVRQFTGATGVRPNLLVYYSSWREPFQARFASTAASHGAVPLVQLNPSGVSLATIAAGQYDSYLIAYARAVRAYGHPVIMSFGHEMNGSWYSWGYTKTSPQVFVAAWRHLVTVFRQQGAGNVTWMWTVNIIEQPGGIPPPDKWWPGKAYVNWVGIDGYYYRSSLTFASLFGPTIADVRELTGDPILIAETAVAPTAQQPAQIDDLFAGIRLYGLLGAVWFQVDKWRLDRPAAVARFRQGAHAYQGSG